MKSLLLFFAMWCCSFAPLGFAAHRMFLEPGDWIGALLVSLFLALGLNGLHKARLERRDAILLARPEGPLKDGQRVAIVGTIEPEAEPLVAPLSGRKCLAPSIRLSALHQVRLKAFPGWNGFPRIGKNDLTSERTVK